MRQPEKSNNLAAESAEHGVSIDTIQDIDACARDLEAGLNPGDSDDFMPSHGSVPFISGGKAHLYRQGPRKGKRR